MSWQTKKKSIAITKVVPHLTEVPGAEERTISATNVEFTPFELFGAAARCSCIAYVDPSVVSDESEAIRALVAKRVDDTSSDFFLLKTAKPLKDFVKGYLAGTVAAGVAYLAMIRDGYVWFDHFENHAGGAPGVKKRPDFIFVGQSGDAALMESKGSASGSMSALDNRVSSGYTDQVEPHIGHRPGGYLASHGFSIGSFMKAPGVAEIRVHHTAVPATASSSRPPDRTPDIQLGNYVTAFALAHSQELASRLQSGVRPERVTFGRFLWQGRWWLTSPFTQLMWLRLIRDFPSHMSRPIFAIEETIARESLDVWPELGELSINLVLEGWRTLNADGLGGAVFPDGFAAIDPGHINWDKYQSFLWKSGAIRNRDRKVGTGQGHIRQ